MKKNKKISKKFIGFLLASIFIWFLITMSKEYVTILTLPVAYKNIPQDKLLQNQPKKEIDIILKASGFKIVSSKFRKKTIQLNAKSLTRKTTGKYYFLTRSQISEIQKQLQTGVRLQEIIQDTLFLNLGSLKTKKIAVIPNLDINYHIGYDLSKKIEIIPDSILVSGPESIVDTITNIKLKKLVLKDVKESLSKEIAIQKSETSNNLNYNKKLVTVNISVEKFTEGSFNIPFEVVNLPEQLQLTMLTKTVEIVYVVALSDFNSINEDSFKIECDYTISEKNNLNYLVPKVVFKPSLIKSVKIIPNKIDFLIQK